MPSTLALIASTDLTPMITLIGAVVGLIVVAAVVVVIVRKRMNSEDKAAAFSSGSLMEQLRKMHAQGKLTDEEFAKARAKLGGKLKAEMLGAKAPAKRVR
jgi:uncharacterized membrane protein